MNDMPVADMTLDEMRPRLIAAMLPHVPFDGWGWQSLDLAARELGVPPEAARLAFPGGATDMIDAWTAQADARMETALANPPARIRDRFRTAILARLEQATPDREAVRKASVVLALPTNARRAAAIAWRSADSIWRAIGDTSTGFSFYSRRAIAMAVYTATLLVWLDDDSEDFADTRAFLDRRIDEVMRFEKTKARWRGPTDGEYFSPVRFFGRLRYPVRD